MDGSVLLYRTITTTVALSWVTFLYSFQEQPTFCVRYVYKIVRIIVDLVSVIDSAAGKGAVKGQLSFFVRPSSKESHHRSTSPDVSPLAVT